MLDLDLLSRFPETIAIGCKPAADGVLVFYPAAVQIGAKTLPGAQKKLKPEGQGLVEFVSAVCDCQVG